MRIAFVGLHGLASSISISLLSGIVLLLLPSNAWSDLPSFLSSSGSIAIVAWSGPPADATSGDYQDLALAGFTHSLATFPHPASAAAALTLAEMHKVQLIVTTREFRNDPRSVVERLKGHPALAGYCLADEPSAREFSELAQTAREIRSLDSNALVYINLYPNTVSRVLLGSWDYLSYLDHYLEAFQPRLLSFDHYPIRKKRFSEEWYENLEAISREARKREIPFWAFVLATAHGKYPIPKISHLRLQAFTSLAYGAQGIQYFTYWMIPPTRHDFHSPPVYWGGRKTRVYERVRQVNREIRALSPVFMDAKVVQTGYTGTPPVGTRSFQPVSPVLCLDTKGRRALVSLLDQPGYRYMVIVNQDYEKEMELKVEFAGTRTVGQVEKDGSITRLERLISRSILAPGDIRVFIWETEI